MKKFTRISLIIVAVLAIIGIVLTCIAGFMGTGPYTIWRMADAGEFNWGILHIGSHGIYFGNDYDEEDVDTVLDDYKEFAAASVKKMVLDVDAAEIMFTESEKNDTIYVMLEAYGRVKKYECSQDGDILKISCTVNKNSWNKVPQLTVSLPEGITFDDVDISIGASEVQSEHDSISCNYLTMTIGAGEFDGQGFYVSEKAIFKLGVGELSLEGGKYNELQLDCGIGEMNFSGEVTGDISAKCGVGEINMWLNADEEDYNYDVKCGLGEIEINDIVYSNISGSRKVKNEGAVKTLKADCGTGEIEIQIYPQASQK